MKQIKKECFGRQDAEAFNPANKCKQCKFFHKCQDSTISKIPHLPTDYYTLNQIG